MSDISLSKAVRTNLLSLQNTADLMATTQKRLATGNKVNSALDNPINWFTAQGLNNRATDLNSLMDSMASGVQTLEAADAGLSAITKTLESMQSTLRQARQDKSFHTSSYQYGQTDYAAGITNDTDADAKAISFSGGAFEATSQISLLKSASATTTLGTLAATFDMDEAGDGLDFTIDVNGQGPTAVTIRGSAGADTITVDVGGDAYTMNVADGAAVTKAEIIAALNGGFTEAELGVTAADVGGNLTFTGPSADPYGDASIALAGGSAANTGGGAAVALADFGFDNPTPTQTTTKAYVAKTLDELVADINKSDSAFAEKIRASNDNGKLRIENQSTQPLTVAGASLGNGTTGTNTDTNEIEGNSVRAKLADQFRELRDQLDKISDDASFNGINLLRGDKLTITFNETGTSSIDIQTDEGKTINAANLKIPTNLEASELDADSNIDKLMGDMKMALDEIRGQASTFGSNLSIVENRQKFTSMMIETLETGAANLTLADMNEEAANLLALQTRQQLSSNSLSLASQADQSVLQLLR
ncbi:hypothetical protein GCM10007989_06840 [Devosia pacifica]|uniref:Flagellin n=1 Tax=Devosia pacifica TaxID=1335967 RepID=A0A918RZM7_9HYPH|nr:flagellin [Devosia pacifica]GHA14774.1 hypothetical protein GCM10007989_06840 [Devosia pacifica]